jgi:hypothetical protein
MRIPKATSEIKEDMNNILHNPKDKALLRNMLKKYAKMPGNTYTRLIMDMCFNRLLGKC